MKNLFNKIKRTALLVILFIHLGMVAGWAQMFQNPVVSPEIAPDNKVTFRILAPKAGEVKLAGNWMPFGQTEALVKGDTGLWTVTVGPLAPEMYGYHFIVDGVNTLDPVNLHTRRDGTWNQESALFIRGEASSLYEPKAGPKGTLHQVWYESPTLGLTRRMYVYTPPGYEKSSDSYPVLYLLHGAGGDEEAWTTLGVAPTILDNLINSGKARPMLVVMTNGNPGQAAAFTDTPILDKKMTDFGEMANKLFEKSLVNDVIPYIESTCRVKKDRASRALSGLSMGGHQTMNTTFENPGMFDYIGVMSMGLADFSNIGIREDPGGREKQIQALKASNPKLYWIACGKEDFLYESVVKLRNELDKNGFKYTYRESEGGHTWAVWRLYLSEFAPVLFR